MTFNSLQELLEERERLKLKKYSYDKALNDAIKNQKKYFRKNNKEYWNSVIETYFEIINKYETELNNIDAIYNNTLSYPKELIIPFVLECINLYENEIYLRRNLMLSLTSHLSINGVLPLVDNFEIIFPKIIEEEEIKLEKSFYISVLQFSYKELFESTDVKYIMMPTEGYINLLNNNLSLNAHFDDFPYLENIGINLIERRLREPDKKIADILNDELNVLKENKNTKNLCK